MLDEEIKKFTNDINEYQKIAEPFNNSIFNLVSDLLK